MDRRKFITGAAAGGALLAGGSLFYHRSLSSVSRDTLSIGYLPITDASPLLIAWEKGYFREEGIRVKRPVLIRSWSALVESFLAGNFDLVHLLFPIAFWLRYKNRNPVKVTAWNHLNGSALTVRSDSGIDSFSDLGGRTIAVPFWYSMHNIVLQMALRKSGLKPLIHAVGRIRQDEVKLVIMAPPEMPSSLASGKIDGFIVAEPFNAIAEIKLKARILRFTGDIWHNHPCCVAVMKEKLLTENPILAQKTMNALVRSQLWINDHREETALILSKHGGNFLPVSKKELMKVFTDYSPEVYGNAIRHPEWKAERIGFQPYPFPSATAYIYNEMKNTIVDGDNSFLKRHGTDHIIKDLVDYSYIKKAVLSVGGPEKFHIPQTGDNWEREEVIEF